MSWLRRLRYGFRRRQFEEDLAEELAHHRALKEHELLDRGHAADEASIESRRALGSLALAMDQSRDVWQWRWLTDAVRDVRLAGRLLQNSPGFTLIAVLTLALGIGANTAVFTVADALLLRPPPFERAHDLYWIYDVNETLRLTVDDETPPSPGNFADWRQQTQTFDYMAAWRNWWYSVAGAGPRGLAAEQVRGIAVSPAFFDMLGVHAALGRTFRPDEEQPGRDRVVVLTAGFWQRRFGGNPRVVGQTVVVDGQPHTIIGVLPADFYFLWPDSALFVPMTVDGDFRRHRSTHSIAVLARLAPGVTRPRAQAALAHLAANLAQAHPATNEGWGAALKPVFPLNKTLRPAVLVLLGAVGCVLLIACLNVASLLLVRAGARQREMAIRTALGASRGRLVRQLLSESLLLATCGAAGGVLLALGGMRLLLPLIPEVQFTRSTVMTLDTRVLLFTMGTAVLAALALGLVPAWHASRREGLRVAVQPRPRMAAGRTLLTMELALSVVLLVGASLLVRSLWHLQHVDPGFRADHLLTMQISLPPTTYADRDSVGGFYQDVLRRLRQFPEVRSAAIVNTRPFLGWWLGARLRIPGRPASPTGDDPIVGFRIISPEYLAAMGTPLIRGRAFAESDDGRGASVVLINKALADRFWPAEDPIGQAIDVRPLGSPSMAPWWPDQPTDTFTVIGVVGNIQESRLRDRVEPTLYLSYLQSTTRYAHLLVRTAATPANVTAVVQRVFQAVDPDLAVYGARSMEAVLDQAVATPRLSSVLFWVFATVALVLSAVGVYGVTSQAVAQRTREFAIRIAMGATAGSVFRLVTREGLMVAVVGIPVGLIGALVAARSASSLLYGVEPTDGVTLGASASLVLLVALFACWRPAWRATRVDPMRILRTD